MKLYYNGNIITMNDALPTAEALLTDGGRIIAVGALKELEKQAAKAVRVDLNGKTLLPGFIDGHSHFLMSRLIPQFPAPPVGDIDSIEKLINAVKAELEKHPVKKGCAFMGMGYDNAAFEGQKNPTKHDLDKISTEIPIVLMHVSGHVGSANSKALELAGINADTSDPDGGVIRREAGSNEPNGVLEETALTGVTLKKLKVMPSLKTIFSQMDEAQEVYASNGYTTVQDGAGSAPTNMLARLYAGLGRLKLDVCCYTMIDGGEKELKKANIHKNAYKKHFRVGGAKLILDGSPQAKTAWLTEPYFEIPEGKPEDYCGYPYFTDEAQLSAYFEFCLNNKVQILVHCNGDAASEQLIRLYTAAIEKTGVTEDLRPVMVHCQTVRDDQLDRMKAIGMRGTVFIGHTYFWGDYHLSSVLGEERGNRISPLASFVKRGMHFTLHQDTPVTPPDIMLSIHQAVNRITAAGRCIGEQQRITVENALKASTIWAAEQYFEESKKGSLEPGKLADMVILDKNPLTVPSEEIKSIKVLETIKEDNTIFSRELNIIA